MTSNFPKKIEYRVFNLINNDFLCDITRTIYHSDADKEYKIGTIIGIPDCFINRNNCIKLRSCLVEKILNNPGKKDSYVICVSPSSREYFPEGYISSNEDRKKDIDRSGEDGWLK